MPEFVVVTKKAVAVEKSVEQLERELSPDGNVDWRVVSRAFAAQLPRGATLTAEERRSLHTSWFNEAMVDEFLPYMSELGHRVTGMRTTCTEEITRDVDGYVELACRGAVSNQSHQVDMVVDDDEWRLRFVEYSYDTDDNTQLSPTLIERNGRVLLAVDEDGIEDDWDSLHAGLRKVMPDKWRLVGQERPANMSYLDEFLGRFDPVAPGGRELNQEPWYFNTGDGDKVATMVAMLVRFYGREE